MSKFDFLIDEEGLTVVEYVVGAGLVAIGLTILFLGFGGLVSEEFSTIFD
ncbi:Flp family type IVb pilin [Vibrio galatheae]|nr:hypothetical protein [Vibrio galatheae]